MMKDWLKKWYIQIILLIIAVIILAPILPTYGTIALILLIVAYPAYRLYKYRHFFIDATKVIEGKMFGKPLDKNLWKKDELKNTRIEVYYNGKPIRKTKKVVKR